MKTLLDFIQSASNAVADNVAGPVDLLGLGLNKLGVPVGDSPIGGTNWQREMGLRRNVPQGPARVLGETAGLLGPAMATKFAPQIAGALNRGGANLAAGGAPAMRGQMGGVLVDPSDYRGSHRAPMKTDDATAPLHALDKIYPADIYSSKALQYYGTGDDVMDKKTIRLLQNYKNNPDASVVMYRAVPKSAPENAVIRNGDWVTINPDYAKLHGDSVLGGDYRVIKQQVPARKLFTEANSIHEFGYDESGKASLGLLGLLGAGTAGGAYLASDK